ncbi:hypothetical protein M8J75_007646 [Diaphorina citri]|nr:hypothetical protein M8J75_007646 [Diaphorina citri]
MEGDYSAPSLQPRNYTFSQLHAALSLQHFNQGKRSQRHSSTAEGLFSPVPAIREREVSVILPGGDSSTQQYSDELLWRILLP